MIAFFAVIYGMYIKISSKASKNYNKNPNISLSLKKEEKIINMQVIDNNNILISIGNSGEIYGIIYDINNQKVLQIIKKWLFNIVSLIILIKRLNIENKMTNKNTKNISFETCLAELEKIVDQLESGNVDLEKSVSLYEKGVELKKICEEKLEKVEIQINKIKQEKNKIIKEKL